jgi:hypothetical protein
MSDTDQQNRPTISLDVVDIHLDYLRKDMRAVLAAIATMATKDDIRALENRMQSFVTRSEFETLASQVKSSSIGSAFDRGLSLATRVGAAAAVFIAAGGGLAAIVHWFDRVPK